VTQPTPVLLLVAGICLAGLLSERTGLPSPVVLVVGGLAVAAIPGVTTVTLDPDLVLTLVLPPLLYSAALDASLLDFRANARSIGLLSVGLVLATALLVGVVMHAVVPGLPLAAAFALGAIVAPPEAVAAIAIGRRAGMPTRLQTVIEGEGLLNDASALTIYAVAVAATTGGGFSFLEAGGQFLLESVGGLAVGLAVAWLIGRVRGRLEAPLVENVLSLATPFLAYLPAQAVHGSGVLAVVVCGLVLGHRTTTLLSGVSRLQTQPVWRLVTFLLEGGVFALIGLQLPEILRGLEVYPVGKLVMWSLVLLAVVLFLRPVWIFPLTYLPRRLSLRLRERDPAPDFRIPLALSWAGIRGVVSLAAAFALPLRDDAGRPSPQRDLLLFLTFVVILTTLLVQGLTLGQVLRGLGLRRDRQATLLAQAAAQQASIEVALRALDAAAAEQHVPDVVVEGLRTLAENRRNAGWERLTEARAEHTGNGRDRYEDETPSAAWRRLRAMMLEAERAELLRLRNTGELPEDAMRELQARLDLEEAGLQRDPQGSA